MHPMIENQSIAFFEKQFRTYEKEAALRLNSFEQLALPYLKGEVLDFGCGMGNLAFEAAKQGCKVLALDGSPAAIEHIHKRAHIENLTVTGRLADLRDYPVQDVYDCVVSIGLLMFFDCTTAASALNTLQNCVRPGGTIVLNVLIQGTTYLEMFDASGYCLFEPNALRESFSDWQIEQFELAEFAAPGGTIKQFCTLVARHTG
jgi:tellurite methyltransferase